MTPKEKAVELYEKFYYQLPSSLSDKIQDCVAQECALIAVDEILDVIDRDMNYQNVYSFYLNVKQEIERL